MHGQLVVVVLMLVGLLVGPAAVTAQQQSDPEATIAALQTQVATLQGTTTPTPVPTSHADGTPAASEISGAETARVQPVNLEIVLDVSGSMGQVLETGETRMDAAKRVLNEVLAAIPTREGINVGLRIYGHEGDNSEAGAAVSCQGSDLVVPVQGVAADELAATINDLVPTGWTPIALSLERAAEDFPIDASDATNAIVLVTDGLETCGGDPAAVAAQLRQSPAQIQTSVIGFALTSEEQQMLATIAQNGDGQLFGAANAAELSSALFSVLETLEIVAGNGYVGGNAFSLIPVGESGILDVVAIAAPADVAGQFLPSLPFVIRNNTTDDLTDIKITATVRDAAGSLIGAADAQWVSPEVITAGGIGFGVLDLDDADSYPLDAVFDIEVEGSPADEQRFVSRYDLDVTEAALVDGRIVAVLENTQDVPLKGPYGVRAVCFDLDGRLTTSDVTFADAGQAAPGETVPVTAEPYNVRRNGVPCPAFLIAGSGHEDRGS